MVDTKTTTETENDFRTKLNNLNLKINFLEDIKFEYQKNSEEIRKDFGKPKDGSDEKKDLDFRLNYIKNLTDAINSVLMDMFGDLEPLLCENVNELTEDEIREYNKLYPFELYKDYDLNNNQIKN